MKKIALIYPIEKKYQNPSYSMTQLGIGYIASYVEQFGHTVDIFDFPLMNIDENQMLEKIKELNYDIIGISTYNYNYEIAVKLTIKIQRLRPSCFIIMGGYQPTLEYERMQGVFSYVDCLIIGEGEKAFANICNNLENNSWQNTPGIVFLDNGQLTATGKSDIITDLDNIPWPKRTVFSKKMNMITMRGCYGQCSFCCKNAFQKLCNANLTRRRSPEDVVNEIEFLVNNGAYTIQFNDDTFEISSINSQRWVDRFISLVKEKHLHFEFRCFFRTKDIIGQHSRIKQLIEIGLVNIYVGIESFVASALELYNKRITPEENIKAFQILDELNISYDYGFILFNPYTTPEDILHTIYIFEKYKFNDKNRWVMPRNLSKTVLLAYHQTPIYDFLSEQDMIDKTKLEYQWIDRRTEEIFEIQQIYQKTMDQAYQYYREDKIENEELEKTYKAIFHVLFQLDLNFLKDITLIVMDSNKTEHEIKWQCNEVLQQYKEKILSITKKLESLSKML